MKSGYQVFEPQGLFNALAKSTSSVELAWIQKKLEKLVYPDLKEEPHFGPHIKKMQGFLSDLYRYRIGHFRHFYRIDEPNKTVVLTAIKPRKIAYR